MRFGIVGTSFIADWLLEASRHVEGFEAAAVCSRRWETGEAFAGKHGIPGVYTDMVQMAESGEIDAAYIASPNGFHAQQCLLFIRRGIPVLCEKAFASNQREAQQVIDEAHERGVFVMEAIKSLFMPSFEALKAALPEIGKVRRAVFNFTRYSSRYDAYLRGEAPNAFKRELSNGSLLDIGVYALHPAVALFGEPRSIFAGGHILEEGRGIDAFATVVMDYQDMQAVIMTSKVHTSHIGSEIQGESGSITIGALGSFTPMALWDNEGKRTDIPTHQLGDRVDMRYELEYFIRQAKSPDPGAWARLDEQTLRVMRLLDEARSQMGLVYPSDEA